MQKKEMLKKRRGSYKRAWAKFEIFAKLVCPTPALPLPCAVPLCASFDNYPIIIIISGPITVNTMVITVASGEKAQSIAEISDTEHTIATKSWQTLGGFPATPPSQ